MKITTLSLVDPAALDPIQLNDDTDNDTWIDSCLHCGTLDNGGDQLCVACDHLAA